MYCFTIPTYAIQGAIFNIGVTASLAWELPHDPYSVLRKKAEAIHRRKDDQKSPSIYIINNKTTNNKKNKAQITNQLQFVTKKPINYYYKPLETTSSSSIIYLKKYSYKNNQIPTDDYKIKPKKYLYDPYMDLHGIHRRTRRDLFVKLEKFLNA